MVEHIYFLHTFKHIYLLSYLLTNLNLNIVYSNMMLKARESKNTIKFNITREPEKRLKTGWDQLVWVTSQCVKCSNSFLRKFIRTFAKKKNTEKLLVVIYKTSILTEFRISVKRQDEEFSLKRVEGIDTRQ